MICGITKIKEVQEVHEILIFKLGATTGTYDYSYTRKVDFSDACNAAFFQEGDEICLLFFTRECVFKYDYTKDNGDDWAQEKVRELVYKF